MSETNYFRLIEAYFEGTISPAEEAMLNAKVKSDPLVKAEFDLQQNILRGIKSTRKLELKSRLASIDLPTQTGILSGSGVKWLAGTVAGITIFGSILYWSLISFNDSINPLDIKTEDRVHFKKQELANFPNAERKVEDLSEIRSSELESRTTKTTKEVEETNESEADETVTARVEPQALISYEDDKIFTNQNEEQLENIASREIAHNSAEKTEVEFFKAIDQENNYHYRYYNSKLYLYGDFKEMPYQIIELNNKGKKQLFLSHNQEVYIINDNTTEITKLIELDDKMLKMEIELIVEE